MVFAQDHALLEQRVAPLTQHVLLGVAAMNRGVHYRLLKLEAVVLVFEGLADVDEFATFVLPHIGDADVRPSLNELQLMSQVLKLDQGLTLDFGLSLNAPPIGKHLDLSLLQRAAYVCLIQLHVSLHLVDLGVPRFQHADHLGQIEVAHDLELSRLALEIFKTATLGDLVLHELGLLYLLQSQLVLQLLYDLLLCDDVLLHPFEVCLDDGLSLLGLCQLLPQFRVAVQLRSQIVELVLVLLPQEYLLEAREDALLPDQVLQLKDGGVGLFL